MSFAQRSGTASGSQAGGIRKVVCGLRKDLYSKFRIAVLKAFIDDSGSGGDSPWYVLAGYVGTVEGWDKFDGLWAHVLRQRPRVAYFKSSEAESLRPDGQWAGISSEQRDEKIDALIEVVAECALHSASVRVRQRDYNAVIKGNVPAPWDDPYYVLTTMLVEDLVLGEEHARHGDVMEFVLDEDTSHRSQFNLMRPAIKGGNGKIVNISRGSDKEFLPLQAADLVAWQIRRFFSVQEPPRRHFHAAQHSLSESPHSLIIERARVVKIMEGMREQARLLAKVL